MYYDCLFLHGNFFVFCHGVDPVVQSSIISVFGLSISSGIHLSNLGTKNSETELNLVFIVCTWPHLWPSAGDSFIPIEASVLI